METINGILLKQMLESGMNLLSNKSGEIDALNVFPVPDGDTGTNMSLTFSAGVKEALNVQSDSVSDIMKVLSKGLLMGARGNSGVITSQDLQRNLSGDRGPGCHQWCTAGKSAGQRIQSSLSCRYASGRRNDPDGRP